MEVKSEVIDLAYGSDEVEVKVAAKSTGKRVRKKRDTIKCPQCPRTFQNNSLLKRHSVSHLGSNRERPHKCVECAKAYTLLPHLREHELKQHGKGEKRFQCKECEFEFYRKADYERHYRTHIGERNFSCHMCTRSFIQKCNLDMHIKTHTGERNFKCEKCGKSFIARSKLVRHYKQGVHCKF